MLKSVAILAVFLAITQAAVRVPREGANPKVDSASSKDAHVGEKKDSTVSTLPATLIKNPPSDTPNCNADAIKKDGWDKAPVFANYLLVVVGILGVLYAAATLVKVKEQAAAAGASAEVAKNALIATQRPKIVVRRVALIPEKLMEGAPFVGPDSQWRIACLFANIGGSKALVVESNLTIKALGVGTLDSLLPSLPDYGKDYCFGTFSIDSGERQEHTIVLKQQPDTVLFRSLSKRAIGGQYTETSPLICYGFIHYQDMSGVGRRTGFGAKWNPKTMGFTRLSSSEYEYQD